MDVVAIQEVLGHEWLNTTMIYVHVDRTHIEDAGSGPQRAPPVRGTGVKWNLRMVAAQRGIWKASELQPMLAEPDWSSAGKMSHLWSSQPVTIRLDDLEVICAVLSCRPVTCLSASRARSGGPRPRPRPARLARPPAAAW